MTDYELMIFQGTVTIVVVSLIALAFGILAVKVANKLIDRWDIKRREEEKADKQ